MSAVPPKREVKSGHWQLPRCAFVGWCIARRVIQAPKPEPRIMLYELTDYEWVGFGGCWNGRLGPGGSGTNGWRS